MIEKILLRVVALFTKKYSGKVSHQHFFERFYELSLKGMNYGGGSVVESSGERVAMEYVKKHISENPLVFDVGSNIGQYATSILELFNNKVSLHCFEPSKVTFETLTKNIMGAKLNNVGIGERKEKLTLYSTPATSEMSSIYQRELTHFNMEMKDTETINLTTIDDYCKENKIDKIDFLKMDIEGHELSALKGAKVMLTNNAIQFIQLEFGGTNIDSRTFIKDFWYLLKDNFNIYRIVNDGLYPVEQYKETSEIFTNVNFLAERK